MWGQVGSSRCLKPAGRPLQAGRYTPRAAADSGRSTSAKTPWSEIISGARSIVPLVAFLFLVLKLLLREKVHDAGILTYGLILSLLGMMIFNLGLTYGLDQLGGQSGNLAPAAFAKLEHVQDSPLYMYGIGVFIVLLFAWVLGFGATLAEPARGQPP